ncbi:HNH endonuclease [Domibacillus iocasae]|uniref:HNH nuclease domain-containing protein n=1 Tax=Domibacillus iocasae TaxID=1714016 RepID=A0A1E7DJV5_9BACI|nr:HNH endonuclease signature motif containing protein [Domibacillus iocasae]OES43343.1 hypothetical protein BA724_13920 [Domibacillus iocasae]
MLSESVHTGILKKFEALKGETLVGKGPIKGLNKENRVPADQFVPEKHILHDLIRGFYKPKDMPYLLSYQATESNENYGRQIIWKDQSKAEFEMIEMRPPSGLKDNRKAGDIAAARYNLQNGIPIGILHKVEKGVNAVLGLGKIVEENEQGVFIVKPYTLKKDLPPSEEQEAALVFETNEIENNIELFTEVLQEIKRRRGQQKFRHLLLLKYDSCAVCGISATYTKASHIKPWSASSDYERLDVYNGLLLCPNHDYLFDQGLISFDASGRIKISPLLSAAHLDKFAVNDEIRIEMDSTIGAYMDYHMKNIFRAAGSIQ